MRKLLTACAFALLLPLVGCEVNVDDRPGTDVNVRRTPSGKTNVDVDVHKPARSTNVDVDVKPGQLPDVDVNVKPGKAPDVDVNVEKKP